MGKMHFKDKLTCVGCCILLSLMSNASENLPKVIAHRGECLEMPENTPMAFSLAKERKLAGFECDIYMSADNKLICTHDRNLKRNFGLDKDTTQASYAEIKDIDVIALGKSWPGVKIPLIEDVLDLAEDGFEIWVELAGPKDHDAIGDASIVPHVKRAVENHPKATPERVLFISFDAGIVKAVKEQMPGYRAYWIKGVRWNSADNAPSISAADLVAKLKWMRADGVDVNFDRKSMPALTAEYISEVKKAGFTFGVFTVDDPDDAYEAARRGVDAITSNCGGRIRDALASRFRQRRFAAEAVLPPDANSVERFAARELSEHWSKATGEEVRCVTNATGTARWTFRLGRAAALDLSGLDVNDGRVGVSADGIVEIAGVDGNGEAMNASTSAGTLFGVYSFLERKLGVRWLWPGEIGTVCPKMERDELSAEAWTVRYMAFATWRAVADVKSSGWTDKSAARRFYADQSLWLRRHRFSTCDRLAKGHAFTTWFGEYGNAHPEWFNEMPDGTRRCDTLNRSGGKRADLISLCASNRELVREIARRWAAGDPSDVVNGNENDTAGKCCCANCLAADATGDDAGRRAMAAAAFAAKSNNWWTALGSVSTRYASFWKALLEEGRKTRQDCRVIGCVYANYSDPPVSGTVLGKNVILRFCPPVMYPWTDEKVAYFKNVWRGWSATGASLMMRPNFTLDGHNFPLAYYRRYADCHDFARAHGLAAVDMDSLTGTFGANGLTTYVIASKNSSPDRALAALEDDYFGAFGSSASVVRDLYAQFERASEAGFAVADPDDSIEGGRYCDFMLSAYRVFPSAMLEGARSRLAAARAVEEDGLVSRRLAFVETGLRDALLVLKAQRGFATYQKTHDRRPFSKAYAELLAFRKDNEGMGYLNLASVDYFESRHWPRHLAMLGPGARELEGWELNLNPDRTVGRWEPQKSLHHWRADYNGVGWYRCRFSLSDDDARRFGKLVFGAVDGRPTIYLNGKVVQEGHPVDDPGLAWRIPFSVNCAGAFRAGENELMVRIGKKARGRSGVHRPVYLEVE